MFEYYFSDASSIAHDYHYHDYHEIFFLLSGENKSFFIEDKTYHVKENDIVFIKKDLLHKSNYLSQGYTRIIVHFSDEFIGDDIATEMETLFADRIHTSENPEVTKAFLQNIGSEKAKKDAFAKNLMKLHFINFLAHCVRNKPAHRTDSPITNPAIERLVKYINSNYHSKISLQQAAKMLKMSEGHLSRLFTANTGFCFREYVAIIRIKNAKQLLRDTKKPIQHIAAECGFNDSNYFSKMFKDMEGISPREYRLTLMPIPPQT